MKRTLIVLLLIVIVVISGCSSNEKVKSDGNKLVDLSYQMYDDTRVSGSGILSAVDLFKDDVSIMVLTGINKEGYYAETNQCYAISDDGLAIQKEKCDMISKTQMVTDTMENSLYHINQLGNFESNIYKDKSGKVRLIKFVQVN